MQGEDSGPKFYSRQRIVATWCLLINCTKGIKWWARERDLGLSESDTSAYFLLRHDKEIAPLWHNLTSVWPEYFISLTFWLNQLFPRRCCRLSFPCWSLGKSGPGFLGRPSDARSGRRRRRHFQSQRTPSGWGQAWSLTQFFFQSAFCIKNIDLPGG